MSRPQSLPKGTVYYYDETAPTHPWIAGMNEILAWEAQTGKKMSELGEASAGDLLFLAYGALARQGDVNPEECPFEAWAPTVMWLLDDDEDDSGEAAASTD